MSDTQLLAKLPHEVLEKAVDHLRAMLSEDSMEDIRALYDQDPENWWLDFHNVWGLEIRNGLRTVAGLYDDMLPEGGWEVFYIPCVEIAIGRLEMPSASCQRAA